MGRIPADAVISRARGGAKRVLLYVKRVDLDVIDSFCSRHEVSRSKLLVESALAVIEEKGERCDCGTCELCEPVHTMRTPTPHPRLR